MRDVSSQAISNTTFLTSWSMVFSQAPYIEFKLVTLYEEVPFQNTYKTAHHFLGLSRVKKCWLASIPDSKRCSIPMRLKKSWNVDCGIARHTYVDVKSLNCIMHRELLENRFLKWGIVPILGVYYISAQQKIQYACLWTVYLERDGCSVQKNLNVCG